MLGALTVAAIANPVLAGPTAGLHYLLVGAAASLAAWVGVRRLGTGRRRSWAWIASGLSCTVLGDLVWAAHARQGEVPFPAPADVPYLLGLVLMTVGGALFLVERQRQLTRRTAVDASVVTLAGSLLLWLLVGSGLVAGTDPDPLVLGVGFAYPLLDLAILGTLAALVLGGRSRTPAHALLIAAFAVLLVADIGYLVAETTVGYIPDQPLDSGWLLTYALLAAAALHPSAGRVAPPEPEGPPTLSTPHLLGLGLPLAAVGVAVVVVGSQRASTDPAAFVLDVVVTAPIGAVMVGLLLCRVALTARALEATIRERDAAHRRELGLATVASSLALADDLDAVRAALSAAGAVVDDPDVRIELWRPGDQGGDATADSAAPCLRVDLTPDPADGALVVRSPRTLPDPARGALRRLVSDVTMALDRCRLVEELRASEQRFSSLVRNAPDAVTVHGAGGRLTYVSPAMGRITGADPDTLLGRPWDALFHPDDLEEVRAAHGRALATARGTALVEARIRHDDEGWRWVETRVTNLLDDPTVAGVVTNQRDTTERQRLQRQLRHQADHDELTGLANRRRFGDVVRSRAEVSDADAVIFLDLDRFKPVNDRYGHALGDRMLVVVAERIRAVVRDGDLAARFGGDEFAVLLPDTTVDVAARIGARLRDAIRAPIDLGEAVVQVDASVGVAAADPSEPGRDLLQDADAAMYAAKAAGRSRTEVHVAGSHAPPEGRAALDNEVRRALDEGQLQLHYRPVHRLVDGAVVGADAVVRLAHPDRGVVPEPDLRAAVRRIGADEAITSWVLREACWEARSWCDRAEGFSITVHVDPLELDRDGLVDEIETVLSTTGLPPSCLTLEVEGSAIACPTPTTAAATAALRGSGVRIRLADLGAGETPVQRLRRAPVDELRLTPRLTHSLSSARFEDTALVRAVLQVARSFELGTSAAGVESSEQRDALLQLGCDRGSGPWWDEPLPSDELALRLGSGPAAPERLALRIGSGPAAPERPTVRRSGPTLRPAPR